MSLVDEAVRYAEVWGMHVFPVSPETKKPAFRRGAAGHPECPDGDCGFKHASIDPEVIRGMWDVYPDAWIGIWLAESGLAVLDIDPRNGGRTPLGLPSTWWARTGGGGTHYYFKVPAGMQLPGSGGTGIDIKHNGYVIMPPSPGYAWQFAPGLRLENWPGKTFKAEAPYVGPRYEYTGPGEVTEAAVAYLRPYGQRFQASVDSGMDRNNSLFILARAIGQLIGGGEIKEEAATTWLETICRDNGLKRTRSTIRSGIRTGRDKDKPLQLTHTDENGRTRVRVTAGKSAA